MLTATAIVINRIQINEEMCKLMNCIFFGINIHNGPRPRIQKVGSVAPPPFWRGFLLVLSRSGRTKIHNVYVDIRIFLYVSKSVQDRVASKSGRSLQGRDLFGSDQGRNLFGSDQGSLRSVRSRSAHPSLLLIPFPVIANWWLR